MWERYRLQAIQGICVLLLSLLPVTSPAADSSSSRALRLFSQLTSTPTSSPVVTSSDVVILVDRSTSVGRLPYHLQTLPFLHQLLRDHLSSSRVAVVGFNGKAGTLYDEISSHGTGPGTTWTSRCAVLKAVRPSFAPLQRTRIADALRLADQLLTEGRSRGHDDLQGQSEGRRQALLLITDAAYRHGVDESPDLWAHIVKGRGGVKVFAAKVGVWAEVDRLKRLTSDAANYYADIETWRNLGKEMITSYVTGKDITTS